MFEVKDKIDDVVDSIEDIASSYYKLTIANAVDKGSKLGSSFAVTIIIILLAFFTLLFAGFGLSYWIGQMLGNPVYGFFIIAGVMMLSIIILIALKRKVIVPIIRNKIIKTIYE